MNARLVYNFRSQFVPAGFHECQQYSVTLNRTEAECSAIWRWQGGSVSVAANCVTRSYIICVSGEMLWRRVKTGKMTHCCVWAEMRRHTCLAMCVMSLLLFMWPCIVINFFIIKPTRCTNFSNLFLERNSTRFGQFLCPSSGVFSLYTQQYVQVCWQLVSRIRMEHPDPAHKLSANLYVLLCVQWKHSWWWTEELSETCRVSFQE